MCYRNHLHQKVLLVVIIIEFSFNESQLIHRQLEIMTFLLLLFLFIRELVWYKKWPTVKFKCNWMVCFQVLFVSVGCPCYKMPIIADKIQFNCCYSDAVDFFRGNLLVLSSNNIFTCSTQIKVFPFKTRVFLHNWSFTHLETL